MPAYPGARTARRLGHIGPHRRPATPLHHRHPGISENPRKPNPHNHFAPSRTTRTHNPESVSAPPSATINQNPQSGPGHRLSLISPVRAGSVSDRLNPSRKRKRPVPAFRPERLCGTQRHPEAHAAPRVRLRMPRYPTQVPVLFMATFAAPLSYGHPRLCGFWAMLISSPLVPESVANGC
jgi:hypothetical protein